jgi:hypothetical protein
MTHTREKIKEDKKLGTKEEVLVTLSQGVPVQERGGSIIFFEKELEKDGKKIGIIREFISINYAKDKFTISIKPTAERKYSDQYGETRFEEDSKRYSRAYKVFTELKKSLNSK